MKRLNSPFLISFAFIFFVIFVCHSMAFASGSCVGNCGGMAPGGCWCDDACEGFGDCCADYQSACVIGGDPPGGGNNDKLSSCVGNCGGMAPGGCWCDDACEGFGDCCADYQSACVIGGDPPGGGVDYGFPWMPKDAVVIYDTNINSYQDVRGTFTNGRIFIYVESVNQGWFGTKSRMMIVIQGPDNNNFYLPQGAVQVAFPYSIYIDYSDISVRNYAVTKTGSTAIYFLSLKDDCGGFDLIKDTLFGVIPGGSMITGVLGIASVIDCFINDSPTKNTLFEEKNSHKIVTALWNNGIIDVDTVGISIPIYQSVDYILKELSASKIAFYAVYKNKNNSGMGPITSGGLKNDVTIEILEDKIAP